MENTRVFVNTPVMWHHKTGGTEKYPGIFRQIPGYFPVPRLYDAAPGNTRESQNYSWICYSCQFIKSFRPFHSFWEEEDLSWEINTSFTEWHIIISWVFSFRVIQLTVRWHTFKTFMFVFINSCSYHKTFRDSWLLKYLINKKKKKKKKKKITSRFSVTRYKPKLSHALTCHFMLDSLHWCPKQRNRTSVLLGEL